VNSAPLPSVTAAIPTYRRAELLRQTLRCLVAQDYPADRLELLIIDNNSGDDTPQVVAEFARQPLAPRYVLETRQGANHARNRAVAEARGEIIVFGDDDIVAEPDWIRQIVRPFHEHPEARVGAVGGAVLPVFPDGCPKWVAAFHQPQVLREDLGPIEDGRVPMSANLAFRREALQAIGGFDVALGRMGKRVFGGDENRVIRGLHREGWTVWFAPAAAVQHQMPAGRTTFRYVARHAFDSARSRVIDRVSVGSAGSYLATRFVGNLLKALGFSLLALLQFIVLQGGPARTSLIRSWRACGYLYQIPRSLFGRG